MYSIYIKKEDSHKYYESDFLGIYSSLALAKEIIIEHHKENKNLYRIYYNYNIFYSEQDKFVEIAEDAAIFTYFTNFN